MTACDRPHIHVLIHHNGLFATRRSKLVAASIPVLQLLQISLLGTSGSLGER